MRPYYEQLDEAPRRRPPTQLRIPSGGAMMLRLLDELKAGPATTAQLARAAGAYDEKKGASCNVVAALRALQRRDLVVRHWIPRRPTPGWGYLWERVEGPGGLAMKPETLPCIECDGPRPGRYYISNDGVKEPICPPCRDERRATREARIRAWWTPERRRQQSLKAMRAARRREVAVTPWLGANVEPEEAVACA